MALLFLVMQKGIGIMMEMDPLSKGGRVVVCALWDFPPESFRIDQGSGTSTRASMIRPKYIVSEYI